ncbi:hypothetical protein [Parachitinimonas caeni]|uniref:DUF1329 domain-containing protein n=1 Tax=Parachitinimonas caeni TaxID=3031301 RepID=A0ABT7DV08_9NEIS|nr:hypothetical protein [Parachitinimonas caeni]MDK2123906.1 hypothetical protein [Parachitinimonas caeni]
MSLISRLLPLGLLALPPVSQAYNVIQTVYPAISAGFYQPVAKDGDILYSTWVNPRSGSNHKPLGWEVLAPGTGLRQAALVPPGVSILVSSANSYFFGEQWWGATDKNIPFCSNPVRRPVGTPYCTDYGIERSADYVYSNDLKIFRALNHFIYPSDGATPKANDKARYTYLHLYNAPDQAQTFGLGQYEMQMVVADAKAYNAWLAKRPWSGSYDGTPGQTIDGVELDQTVSAEWMPEIKALDLPKLETAVIKAFRLPVAPVHANTATTLYVAAKVDGVYFYLTPTGWRDSNSMREVEFAHRTETTASYQLDILPDPTNLAAMKGLELYIGYGVNNAPGGPLADLVKHQRYVQLLGM